MRLISGSAEKYGIDDLALELALYGFEQVSSHMDLYSKGGMSGMEHVTRFKRLPDGTMPEIELTVTSVNGETNQANARIPSAGGYKALDTDFLPIEEIPDEVGSHMNGMELHYHRSHQK